MTEKYVIETAKAAKDLDGAYASAKGEAKKYGFSSVAALKVDVVKKAMTDSKKAAEFVVEIDAKKTLIAQLVCEVKGSTRSVIGRSEITSLDDFNKFTALAKVAAFKKVASSTFV